MGKKKQEKFLFLQLLVTFGKFLKTLGVNFLIHKMVVTIVLIPIAVKYREIIYMMPLSKWLPAFNKC